MLLDSVNEMLSALYKYYQTSQMNETTFKLHPDKGFYTGS